jgi:hypothetical protein
MPETLEDDNWLREAREHLLEVNGKGRWPLDPDYLREFITRQARRSPGWATAYALLEVAKAINVLGGHIGGVDSYTGIQLVGVQLERIADALEKPVSQKVCD